MDCLGKEIMTKICHIVDELRVGGLEKTLLHIVLNLKSYEHQVWCLKNKGAWAGLVERQGIKVREFNFEGRISFAAIFRLAYELKKDNFRIIHSHGIFPSMWGRVSGVLAGIPVNIVHCQNLYYDVAFKDRLKLRFLSLFTDKIIAVSEAVKRCLVSYIGIEPRKIEVIYNSAQEVKPLVPEAKNTARARAGIPENSLVAGYIGRLEEHKGVCYLLEAMYLIKEKGVAIKCLIVGEGPAREALTQKAKQLNLENDVFFPGVCIQAQDFLPAMDIFVLPSVMKEGLSLALAEAAAAGLPLIATDVGGNPEIVENNLNGFIVPPKDSRAIAEKILFLSNNPKYREKMSHDSRRIWQEKFNLARMIEKISGVYEEQIRRKGLGRK